jgi:hypothetical protein
MAKVIDAVDDFVLSLDSLIRVGGVAPVESDEVDDYEKIAKALESAREKYGVHFQGDEAKLLFDKNGEYVGSSMPINIQGTFDKSEVVSLNHFIARKSPDIHLCLVEGCKEPAIKTAENKFSNGQSHVKRNHPEVVPFSLWNTNMLSKREAVWNELNSVLKKRKSVESPSEGGRSSTPGHKQMPFSFNPPPNSTSKRKSSLSDITFLLVKFICLGLFAMAITRNPGFVYLVQQLTVGVKLSSPNTIQRRLLKEFADLVKFRREFFEANKINDAPAEDNEVDLDPHIYHRIFSLQYDCWTNRASEAFLGLTLFFIDKMWNLQNISLGCVPFGGRHTAAKTLELITDVRTFYSYCHDSL